MLDIFGNQFTGTIPASIARVKGLQILHFKDNSLTGTIPSEFGDLPYLSWFDISQNYISGTIPSSFGNSQSLEDIRIVDNYIYGTIPSNLCTNQKINAGATQVYHCHGIACPQGWYSTRGFSSIDNQCEKCPSGTSNLYMASSFCDEFTEQDILGIFYEVMNGPEWDDEDQVNWSNYDVSVCEWAGIDCDDNGTITSMSLPFTSPFDDDI